MISPGEGGEGLRILQALVALIRILVPVDNVAKAAFEAAGSVQHAEVDQWDGAAKRATASSVVALETCQEQRCWRLPQCT